MRRVEHNCLQLRPVGVGAPCAPLSQRVGQAERLEREMCVKHNMSCYNLCIGSLGDMGANWGGEARMLQNIHVLLHFLRQGVGQAERLEREMCET